MPQAPASAQASVTAQAITVTLNSLPPYVIAGFTGYTFTGKVLIDTVGYAGQTVEVAIVSRDGADKIPTLVASGTTNLEGTFALTPWVPTPGYGCHTYEFIARHVESNTYSGRQGSAVAFKTRIRDLTVPSSVGVGETFTVSGFLEYESSSGVWSPLDGRSVNIHYNGNLLGTATTGTDGKFSLSCSIPDSGTFTVKTEFAGEGLPAAAALAAVTVSDIAKVLAVGVILGLLIYVLKGKG